MKGDSKRHNAGEKGALNRSGASGRPTDQVDGWQANWRATRPASIGSVRSVEVKIVDVALGGSHNERQSVNIIAR